MKQTLGSFALVVRDYDEAIAYYTQVLGFDLLEDTARDDGKRWVRVAPPGRMPKCRERREAQERPPGSSETSILLAQAGNEAQRARIGDQTGGRVGFFLHTDDFRRDHAALSARGVRFMESPREEAYGLVAVFEDLYGNRWDLLELKS